MIRFRLSLTCFTRACALALTLVCGLLPFPPALIKRKIRAKKKCAYYAYYACYAQMTPSATEWILSLSLSLRDGIRMGILAPIMTWATVRCR